MPRPSDRSNQRGGDPRSDPRGERAGERAQVGVVPWRIDRHGAIELLVITTRRSDRWTIPKGNVPRHLTPTVAAAREAFEEAGLIGPIGPAVGDFRYRKRGLEHVVTLYALRPFVELPLWPEARWRRRAWLPLPEAVAIVHHDGLRRALAGLPRVAVA